MDTPLAAFSVRPAVAHDDLALADLREQWRWESHGVPPGSDPTFTTRFRAWFRGQLTAGSLAWVAEDAGTVGMLVMFVHERMPEPARPTTSWGYIGNVFVHPARRGVGAGAALLSAAINEAKRRELARLILNPTPRSVSLYQRAGFSSSNGLLTLELR